MFVDKGVSQLLYFDVKPISIKTIASFMLISNMNFTHQDLSNIVYYTQALSLYSPPPRYLLRNEKTCILNKMNFRPFQMTPGINNVKSLTFTYSSSRFFLEGLCIGDEEEFSESDYEDDDGDENTEQDASEKDHDEL